MDRLLAHGVYWIFAEPRLVIYIEAGRRALWPDPNSSPLRPRGVDEMEKARKDAERRILRTIPGKKYDLVWSCCTAFIWTMLINKEYMPFSIIAPLRDTFFGDQG